MCVCIHCGFCLFVFMACLKLNLLAEDDLELLADSPVSGKAYLSVLLSFDEICLQFGLSLTFFVL